VELAWKGRPAHVREMGQGPAVVLVHGYPLDGAMWSGVARNLSEHFRVLKPDLPGRGGTAAPPSVRLEDCADFLDTILAALPEPVGLAGFSMGGYAVLSVAARAPRNLRALALLDTRADGEDAAGRARRDEAIAAVRSGGAAAIAEEMIRRLLAPDSLRNRELVERVRRLILRQNAETLEADLEAMRERPDQTATLPRIAVPTLVMVGEEDAISTPAEARRMAEAIPGSTFVTIPAAAHLTPMERPGAVADALADFFAGVLAPRA